MTDDSSNPPKRTEVDVVDQDFLFGDIGPKQKIDAWDGDIDLELITDSGEMALANLHFGTIEEEDLTKSESEDEAPASNNTALESGLSEGAIAVEVLENDSGALIGSLSAFDASDIETADFIISDARFQVTDGELRLADGVSLNFEDAAEVGVTVSAQGPDGETITEVFSIDVIDVNDAPTDLALDGKTVAENDAGATVGTLSSFDPDAGDTVTYTVSDDRFEVVDGELRLADGVSLDHEEAASIEVTVTATDSEGLSTEEAFSINVSDVNEGPSDLALDGDTVSENDAGATVGTLSSFDPDAGDTVAYTVSDDRFEVVDGELRLADGVSLDHEEAASIEVSVTATDSGGLSTEEAFSIDVSDVNEGPSDLALDGDTVAENDAGATVGTLSSFDPDAGDTVTYAVSDDRFEVVDGELRLADGVSLDHEDAASVEVTVTATDSEGLSTEEAFSIDVADVNEGPSDLALDSSTVAENDTGATVGTLSSFDPDAGDSVFYTVSDDRFEVVDGELRLADGMSLDHEEAASIEVTVTATDSDGLSTEEAFSIDVADVNEGPSDLALDGDTVAENDAGATVGTLSSFDPDAGDTVTYAVSDDRFEVVDGELRLADGVSLNHEEAASIEVSVTATDSGGLSTEEAFSIDVADVNEGPSDLALDGDTVSENDAGATVGTLSSFDPDAGDTVSYTVSDDRFEVVDGELRLADGMSLDHEDAASIEVTVTATDSEGLSTEEAFSIDVADVNEGPSDLALDGNTVAENDAGATVGTLSSFDPDAGDTVTYAVSDDRFEVVDGELRLADGVSLDHEEAASIEVTVTATDSEGLSTDEAFSINVADVNEGPSDLALDGNTVAENDAGATVGTLSSFDPDDGDTVTYTVSDDRFEVADGELRLAEGVTLNHEEVDSIDVTVTATDSDGLSTQEAFSIDVTDVNEGPSDLALARETGVAESDFSAADGHSGDSIQLMGLESDAIVFTMSFTTADDVSSTQTLFETGGSVYGTNVVIEDGMLQIYAGEGNDLELSVPIEGDTEYGFALELDTENDTIRILLSDELPLEEMSAENSLVASLDDWGDRDYTGSNQMGVGDEAGGSSQGNISGDFQGEIAEPGLQVFSDASLDDVFTEVGVLENTEGAVVGTLSSFDPDAGDTVTYTVSDDRFEVVDGEVRLADGITLDHEEASSIDLEITATDSGGLSTSETFTIDVLDLNDGPSDLSFDGASIDENSTEGVVGTASVTDQDVGDTHTFSLVDNEGQPFAIDAETGEISLISPGVPEGSVLHIDASEADSLSGDDGISAVQDLSLTDATIGQSDADQRPDFTNDGPFGGPGLQFDGENDRLDIADDSAINLSSQSERSFAMTIQTGEDVETRQVIFEEGGTVNGFNFYIDDGELYMGAWSESTGWDFQAISMEVEPGESYSIVTVYDGASGSYTAHVNGEEVGSIEVGDTMSGHSGNIGLGGIAQHTEFHDGQSSANEGFYFEGSVGEFVVYNEALDSADVTAIDMDFRGIDPGVDFETQDSYDLTVQVTDAAGETYQEVITVDVNDLNEGPSDLALDGNSVAENDAGATVGTLSSFDPDAGDTVTYTVSDDRFEVVDGELRLADGVSLNHEEAASIEVTVTATDSEGLSTEEAFSIDVADVNEGPSDLALDGNTFAENDAGATVGTLSSFDPDAGDTVTYTVSDDRFEVVDGELRLADDVSLDHEEAASIEVTVTATDSEGLSTEEAFSIDVADVNEGPSDLSLDGSMVAENDTGATVGTLSSFDPDAGDTVSYTVSDDRFEVVDGELRLADGVSLDHEEAASIEVTVTATDADGLSTQEDFNIEVSDVNEGPSDLALDGTTVAENDAGATVGTLSSFDPDAGDSVSYTVSDDRFEVVDGELRLADGVSLNHEEVDSIDVTVTATDSDGLSTQEAFTIDVADVNEAPTDLQLDAVDGSLSLNQDGGTDDNAIAANITDFPTDAVTVEVQFTADGMPEGSGAPLFSYAGGGSGGNDVLLWGESSSGNLAVFLDGQKFPTDISNADLFDGEEHTVSFTWDEASGDLTVFVDGEAEYTQSVNVSELPSNGTITLGQEQDSIGGNYDSGQVFQGEISEVRIYDEALSEDQVADNAAGNVTEDGMVTNWVMDEAVDGVVYDAAGNNDLVLQNEANIDSEVGEGPLSIQENAEGVVVGSLSAVDPDAGDTVTFSVSDDRFEVVDGDLRLVDGVSLDHEEAESLDITVTATDSGGAETSETFTINVDDVNEGPSDLTLETSSENLITGGSFEEQSVSSGGWRGFGEDASGNWDTANGMEVWDNLWGTEAAEGSQFLELDYTNAADAISQTVSTEAGQVYTLSLDVKGRDTGADTDSIEVYWNGELVDVVDPSSTDWETVSFDVVGTGGNDVLEFREVEDQSDGLGAHMDNISLIEVPMTVAENAEGVEIGSVSAFDPDAGDSITFTVSDDRFEVVDGDLRLVDGVSLDHEDAASLDIEVTATDSEGLSTTESFTINVADVNEAPSDIELSTKSEAFLEQDGLLVIEAENYDSASDGSGGHAWGESDNAGMMHVDDGSNAYDMWKGESSVEQDSPELTYSIQIDTPGTYYVHVLGTAEDGPRGNADSVHIGIDGERMTDDGGLTGFGGGGWGDSDTYSGNVVEITFDSAGTFDLNLWAREDGVAVDQIVLTQDENFNPNAQDLTESPRVGGLSVDENEAGARVASVSSFDQDAGDAVTYTVSDDRFEVVDGDLKLAEGESLDYEAEQSVDVTVTATDNDGAEASESFTIEVNDVADTDGGVKVVGSDGDDTLKGGTGNDEIYGGDGDDLFIYEADGGSDSFDGGASWTDTVDLSNALSDDAVYGDDWTVTVTEGEIVVETADSIELSDDAAGFISLDNGETIDFTNIEQIGF